MSSFRKICLTIAALTGFAVAGAVVAADEASKGGCAGEHRAEGHGKHDAQRMSEMHKRMQAGEHGRHGEKQKEEKPQPQGEEHKH